MYENHFELSGLAFQRASNPDEFFRSEAFETTLLALRQGIRCDCGLMLLTGESGVGKTAVVQLLERELRGNSQFIAFDRRIFDVDETENDWERTHPPTLDGVEDLVFSRLVEASRRRPDSSIPILAVVDDAHMASAIDLMGLLWATARLRAGANGTDRPGLLLVGDTELEQRFRCAPLRALERDVSLQCRMAPLSPDQVDGYIRFHLERAGYRGEALFSDAAIACVEHYSRGIPQLINNICGMALVITAEEGVHQVTEEIVRDAASDLLAPPQTLESAAPSACPSFDEQFVSASESDPRCDHVPKQVEDLDLWLCAPRCGLLVAEMHGDEASSHGLEPWGDRLRSRAGRAWHGMKRIRQRLESRFQSARRAMQRRLKKPWCDSRVAQLWGSHLISIRHLSEYARAAVRRARERPALNMHWLAAGLKRPWQKPPFDPEGGRPGRATSTSPWSSKQTLLQIWQLRTAIAFSSLMAVLAISIWTLVLTHERATAPEDDRSPSAAVATRSEASITPMKTAQAREKLAQALFSPTTLEEKPTVQSPIATGVVVDDEKAGAYQIVALTGPESWSDERSEGLPQASVLKHGGEPAPSTIESAMTSKAEIANHTPKSSFPSVNDAEARMTTEAVTEPRVSSQTHEDSPEAASGNRDTRTTLDRRAPRKIYVVAPGDTLWSISRQHKMTLDRLRSVNGLSDQHVIQPGQRLQIESAVDRGQKSDAWHTVQQGENLFQIGRRYGISVTELKALNSLADPSRLRVGQRLRVGAAAPDHHQASKKRAPTESAHQG